MLIASLLCLVVSGCGDWTNYKTLFDEVDQAAGEMAACPDVNIDPYLRAFRIKLDRVEPAIKTEKGRKILDAYRQAAHHAYMSTLSFRIYKASENKKNLEEASQELSYMRNFIETARRNLHR